MTGGGEHHVTVAGEGLHDLFCLKVPEVYEVVLRAAHDPLAAGDGEVGEDAVLLVLVARVGLQALALTVVPELERVVESGGQDVLAIRGELNERDRRIVVVCVQMWISHIRCKRFASESEKKSRATDERLEALAGSGVPNTHETVVAARHDERAVAVEVDGTHRIRVRRQSSQAFARLHVPNAHRLVERARSNEIGLRIEIATENIVVVSLEGL
jgi:hypothetical protein